MCIKLCFELFSLVFMQLEFFFNYYNALYNSIILCRRLMRTPRFGHNNSKRTDPNTMDITFFAIFGNGCCKLVKAKLLYVTQKGEKLREREGLILIHVPLLEGGTVTRRIS